MTAGAAATRTNNEITEHAKDSTLPHEPRRLTRSERNRREIFVFHSKRNDRVVTVSDFLHLAIALRFEFDANLTCYVERPRRIVLSPKQQIDLSFWTRDRTGHEHYYLAIPNAGTMGSTTGTVSIRDRDVLDAAAARHDLQLSYVTEREMISAMAQSATALELLPHLWAYGRLTARSTIRAQINALLANAPRTTLAQLIHSMDFQPANIRAVVAGMIHDGTMRLVDYTPGSTIATLEVAHA